MVAVVVATPGTTAATDAEGGTACADAGFASTKITTAHSNPIALAITVLNGGRSFNHSHANPATHSGCKLNSTSTFTIDVAINAELRHTVNPARRSPPRTKCHPVSARCLWMYVTVLYAADVSIHNINTGASSAVGPGVRGGGV